MRNAGMNTNLMAGSDRQSTSLTAKLVDLAERRRAREPRRLSSSYLHLHAPSELGTSAGGDDHAIAPPTGVACIRPHELSNGTNRVHDRRARGIRRERRERTSLWLLSGGTMAVYVAAKEKQ